MCEEDPAPRCGVGLGVVVVVVVQICVFGLVIVFGGGGLVIVFGGGGLVIVFGGGANTYIYINKVRAREVVFCCKGRKNSKNGKKYQFCNLEIAK